MSATPPLSVVIPVRNGAAWLDDVLAAIGTQTYGGVIEIIAVDDGSTDDSPRILARHAAAGTVRVVEGPRRGAAAALNTGFAIASHPLVAQIDQDVVIRPDWTAQLVAALDDPGVAAAQGQYVTARQAGFWSRVMALDLRERYTHIVDGRTDHVCTGNSIYRAPAVRDVGGFDESLGYGYDNDLSYRLTGAEWRLVYCAAAQSEHHWREGVREYVRQQYGLGYGRLDLIAKHRGRLGGDRVSRPSMMLHGPAMLFAVVLGIASGGLALTGLPARWPLLAALAVVAAASIERFIAGLRAQRQFRDPAGFWFVPAHFVRDLAWAAAIVVWTIRRLRGTNRTPSDSMRARRHGSGMSPPSAS
jgi:GT2 family glycosyltransferase